MELNVIDISRKDSESVNSGEKVQTVFAEGTYRNKSEKSEREEKRARERQNRRSSGLDKGTALQKLEIRKKRRRKRQLRRAGILLLMLAGIFLLCFFLYLVIRGIAGYGLLKGVLNEERRALVYKNAVEKPVITEDFLTVNPNSRPGYELKEVKNIFVHYTANPGTSAAQNRSYFENLGITKETSASAHFIIGYEGEIVQCLPLDEIGYAVKTRNQDSISIECCYLSEDGKFTGQTYESLISLTAWLLNEYNLTPDDILRHYDEGGKKCPLYYVEHENEWQQFLLDVKMYILTSNQKETIS